LIEVLPHHKGLLTKLRDWGNSILVEEMKDLYSRVKWRIFGMCLVHSHRRLGWSVDSETERKINQEDLRIFPMKTVYSVFLT